jgi:hypothetical protein
MSFVCVPQVAAVLHAEVRPTSIRPPRATLALTTCVRVGNKRLRKDRFQLAQVAEPRALFAATLAHIGRVRLARNSG